MKLAELQDILYEADPAAVLVAPRVLERVIQETCHLPGLVWTVPHAKSVVVDRQMLFRHVEQQDLAVDADQLLPAQVILLARPPADEINAREPEPLLLEYWQRLFHAKVHQALERRQRDGDLTDTDIRSRIEEIGQAEFEEIRAVLQDEAYLLPGATPAHVYIELVAVFLELSYFAPRLLPAYFPGVRGQENIFRLMHSDVNAEEIYLQTRLRGAPEPMIRGEGTSQEAHEYYWRLVNQSERVEKQGNLVQAAILARKAARVAPAALTFGTRAGAVQKLKLLMDRLQDALQLGEGEVGEWMKDLSNLIDQADQGHRPVEALLLEDLQKAYQDYEREIYSLDLIEWAMAGGKRPLIRPLSSQRMVRLLGHLRAAQGRVPQTRLTDADRQHFSALVERALSSTEERIRAHFRPILTTALHDVGLLPGDPIEQAAFSKVVENILDRIVENGFLTFGDLRDCISGNQLKLPDLGYPQEFLRGDPLLRLDRRLAILLDGIYRSSEIYLRMIERFTALNFGTRVGRLLTQWVTIPFGGAFLLVEGTLLLINMVRHWVVPPYHLVPEDAPALPETAARTVGVLGSAFGQGQFSAGWSVLEGRHEVAFSPLAYLPICLAIGLLFLGLLHRESWRRKAARWLGRLGGLLRRVLLDWPVALIRIPAFKQFLFSWPLQLLYWYVFKPLAVCGLIWLAFPDAFHSPAAAVGIVVAVYLALNSRIGRGVSEVMWQSVLAFFRLLRQGLISGLIFLLVRVLKQVTDAVEYLLFRVQEWLRFRSGESKLSMVIRAVLGLFWFPIAYLMRFYIVVLVEPCLHPVKLPISILAAKFVYPVLVPLLFWPTVHYCEDLMGSVLAYAFVSVQLWLLPDAFGFFFWEMKGNWALYKANRSPTLKPVPIGEHGETMGQLLHAGFHSGTVPRFFARLRQAQLVAIQSGNGSAARAAQRDLEKVEQRVRQFVTREMIQLLGQGHSWQNTGIHVGRVTLATNRITVDLGLDAEPERPVRLDFESCRLWLVAGLRERGWLGRLTEEQGHALNTALAMLYKLAGVDLVREQLRTTLVPPITTYDITAKGLQLWRDRLQGHAVTVDLREPESKAAAVYRNGLANWPDIDFHRLLFRDVQLTWEQCIESWQKDEDGQGHPLLVVGGAEVNLLGDLPGGGSPVAMVI